MKNRSRFGWIFASLIVLITACTNDRPVPTRLVSTPSLTSAPAIDRLSRIPADAVKMTADSDPHPPQVLLDGHAAPVPVPGAVNTAGAEDSPFITPDGNTLYFFFTPDLNIPADKQLLDGVTGLYVSHLADGEWGPPERVVLQDPGKLALDGCEFVQGNVMWFCSAREDYTGIHWFTAQFRNGKWQDWRLEDFDPNFQVGELHLTVDDNQIYFASSRSGGKGGLDIWTARQVDDIWQEPVNVAAVNTPVDDGWPALSPDESQLWLTRNYGLWRSTYKGGEWQTPVQVITSLAGEASLDAAGNVYFVHHYIEGDKMIEADIFVAYRK